MALAKESAVEAAYADIATRRAEHAEAFARRAYYVDDEGQLATDAAARDEVAARFGHPSRAVAPPAWQDAGVIDGKRTERRSGTIDGTEGMTEERRFDEHGHVVEHVLSRPSHDFRTTTTTRFDGEGRPTERRVDSMNGPAKSQTRIRDVTWMYAPANAVTIRRVWPRGTDIVEATRRADGSLQVLARK